ncbi:MAG: restriction endonuclease subunit S [Elusimicrobia bacterium]|nr:restriction endonuclease subunit S [Elusimicrobiota bacterium]
MDEISSLRKELVEPSLAGSNRYVGLEHIDPGISQIRRWGNDKDLRSTKSRFYAGDILYGKLRPYLDKAVFAEWEGVCSTDILTLTSRAEVADPRYVSFLLHTAAFINHAVATTSGVNHPRTSWASIASFLHPIPPLAEQRAIAAVLSKIQAAAETQGKIVAGLKELKTATMAKLFREGLHGEPLKQTEDGEIPESWDVGCVGDHCEKPQYGYTQSATKEPTGPKFLRITDITDDGVDWDSVPYCQCPFSLVNQYKLAPGDLVFARIGATTGKSYLIKECPTAVFASYLIRLRANTEIDSSFLSLFFQSEAYWQQISANKGRNLKGGMSASVLANLLFPIPPIQDQQAIAKVIARLDRAISRHTKEQQTLAILFASMLHLLMTGQVRADHPSFGVILGDAVSIGREAKQ